MLIGKESLLERNAREETAVIATALFEKSLVVSGRVHGTGEYRSVYRGFQAGPADGFLVVKPTESLTPTAVSPSDPSVLQYEPADSSPAGRRKAA